MRLNSVISGMSSGSDEVSSVSRSTRSDGRSRGESSTSLVESLYLRSMSAHKYLNADKGNEACLLLSLGRREIVRSGIGSGPQLLLCDVDDGFLRSV